MKDHSQYLTILQKSSIRLLFILLIGITQLTSCFSGEDTVLEGRYTTAFEISDFMPCNTRYQKEYWDSANNNSVYWLTSTPESNFNEQLKTYLHLLGPTGELNMYVKFVGNISPTKKNGYGHLGMYSNQVTVTEVVEMEPWMDQQCPLE